MNSLEQSPTDSQLCPRTSASQPSFPSNKARDCRVSKTSYGFNCASTLTFEKWILIWVCKVSAYSLWVRRYHSKRTEFSSLSSLPWSLPSGFLIALQTLHSIPRAFLFKPLNIALSHQTTLQSISLSWLYKQGTRGEWKGTIPSCCWIPSS